MLSVTDRLKNVRELYKNRGDARSNQETGLLFYTGFLAVLVSGVPVIRALYLLLSEATVLDSLVSTAAKPVLALISATGLIGFILFGGILGPVSPNPFFVSLLAGTDAPKQRTLAKNFYTTVLLLILVFTGIASLFSTVLVLADLSSIENAAVFVVAVAAFAGLCGVLWLIGQTKKSRLWLVLALVVFAGLSFFFEPLKLVQPWWWVAELWPAKLVIIQSSEILNLGLLLVVSALSFLLVPQLLYRLSEVELLKQAKRWQSAGLAAYTGDLASASAQFRAKAKLARNLQAVSLKTAALRTLQSDFVGLVRNPGRLIISVLSLIFAAALIFLSAESSGLSSHWLLTTLGSGLAFLSLGALSDSFRHSAETTSYPSAIYGYSVSKLYLYQTLLPALVIIVSAIISFLGVTLFVAQPPLWSVLWVLVLLLLQLLLRIYDSAKGQASVALLTASFPSPAGDPAVLMILAWQIDAFLISVLSAAGLTLVLNTADFLSLALSLAGLVLLLLWRTRVRIQNLRF